MAKQKELTLRAFSVECNSITENTNTLLDLLGTRLNNSVAGDRVLRINASDTEEDLLASFQIGEHYIFGTMLRFTRGGLRGEFNLEMFNNERISIEEITSSNTDETISYRSHYYFLIKNDRVIVSLPSDHTIRRLQTYLNWLVERERGDTLFEFVPIISQNIPTQTLGSITSIKMGNSRLPSQEGREQGGMLSRVLDFGVDMLREMFQDNAELQEIIDNHLVVANLHISFKKKRPNSMSREDFERTLGAILTPIADLEGVQFETKNGKYISGEEIQRKKKIRVDTTDAGHISEEDLKQVMTSFITEINQS